MDVNGTRFHLLLGQDDWLPTFQDDALFWDDERASVSLKPLVFRFPTPPGDRLPQVADRRGAARDRFGNWYWIAESESEIRFLSPDTQASEHFWSAEDEARREKHAPELGDFQPVSPPSLPESLSLRGLAVTEHHYLVVGTLEPAGLLIFDLHAGGPPMQMLWPAQVPFCPFDMAPRPGGGLWILDRPLDDAEGEARYWALDRYFRVVGQDQAAETLQESYLHDFQPRTGPQRRQLGRSFPLGISLALASPLPELEPVAIEALPDDTVLLMTTEAHSTLYRYHFGRQVGEALPLDQALKGYVEVEPSEESSNPFGLQGHDLAFVPDEQPCPEVEGTLYIVASDGNQAFAFHLKAAAKTLPLDPGDPSFSLELARKYYPMRRFSGKALVAADGAVYYDLEDRWLPLAAQPRPRYETEGVLATGAFDGREPDCVWHRLFLDGCIPTGTAVTVESRSANQWQLLAAIPWQAEPSLYLRATGTEVPYYRAFTPEEAQREGAGTWELLFQHARGRYLQLRLTLTGTGRSTPRLHALRAYYPRFSYLEEYLPAAYQIDATSSLFLERFLANMEGTYTTLEGRIAEVQALFDVRIVTSDYLDWLGTWFGVTLDPAWDEARQRLFIRHAVELFRQRGTLAGLIRAIRLAIDPCPDDSLFEDDVLAENAGQCKIGSQIVRYSVRIVEQFLLRSAPGVAYGDPTQPDVPRLTATSEGWSPEQGAAPLHRQFQGFLRKKYSVLGALKTSWGQPDLGAFNQMLLSPVLPANDNEAEDWRQFTQQELSFTYAEVNDEDEDTYQEFLRHRYRRIASLNSAYQTEHTTFSQVSLPGENDFPSNGQRLYDWIQFVSLVLPIKQYAHRFAVLVPTGPGDVAAQAEQLALVKRIVELEKPAHTSFEVKPYWALFRVGEARLGLDTLLDVGSRFVALLLGQSYLAESYLAAPHPWNVAERIVTDRNAVGPDLVL